MPKDDKSQPPVIGVTASETVATAVPSKSPAIGTASTTTPSKSVTATASGPSTSPGFTVNAESDVAAPGFKAAASNGSTATATAESGEEEFIESVVANKADETTDDSDEEGKVTVPKDVIKELLKDYEAPKDESIKEAFRSMVANYFVFRDNYAVIKQEWDDKRKEMDPSLMDRIQGIDPTPANIAKTIIKGCAEKWGINKKPDVQADNTTSSPTVKPVSNSPDPTKEDGTASPAEGGSFTDKLAQKVKEVLGSLKKKIIDLTSGANPVKDQNNNADVHSVATSDEIGKAAATKKATGDKDTSSQAAVNPELAGEFANQAGKMAELSRSSSDLATSSDLAAKTANPAAEPVLNMMQQRAAAAAKEDQKLPKSTTSAGPEGTTIGQPVASMGPRAH